MYMPYTTATELLAKELNVKVDITLLRLLEEEIEKVKEKKTKEVCNE